MKFGHRLFLQLDSYDKALFLSHKFVNIAALQKNTRANIFRKHFMLSERAFYARMMSNNIMSQIIVQSFFP